MAHRDRGLQAASCLCLRQVCATANILWNHWEGGPRENWESSPAELSEVTTHLEGIRIIAGCDGKCGWAQVKSFQEADWTVVPEASPGLAGHKERHRLEMGTALPGLWGEFASKAPAEMHSKRWKFKQTGAATTSPWLGRNVGKLKVNASFAQKMKLTLAAEKVPVVLQPLSPPSTGGVCQTETSDGF